MPDVLHHCHLCFLLFYHLTEAQYNDLHVHMLSTFSFDLHKIRKISTIKKTFKIQTSRHMLFSCNSVNKEPASNAGDQGSIPGSRISLGEGNGNPLQYSFLENPMDGGAWEATVLEVRKSQTRLSNFTFLSSALAQRIPWTKAGYNTWNSKSRIEVSD